MACGNGREYVAMRRRRTDGRDIANCAADARLRPNAPVENTVFKMAIIFFSRQRDRARARRILCAVKSPSHARASFLNNDREERVS